MPADAAEIVRLATRCEDARGTDAEQIKELLWEAFRAVHGPKPPRVAGGSDELDAYLEVSNPFFYLLKAGGFIDAAMTLVPEGWEWTARGPCGAASGDPTKCFARLQSADFRSVTYGKGETWLTDVLAGKDAKAEAATPALALTAAALRARAAQHDHEVG